MLSERLILPLCEPIILTGKAKGIVDSSNNYPSKCCSNIELNYLFTSKRFKGYLISGWIDSFLFYYFFELSIRF